MTRAGIAARVAVQGAAFLLLAPVQVVATKVGASWAGHVPLLFHRLFLFLFGVQVRVLGTPPRPGEATFIVANHVSWLDVAVMGSLVPLSFVAKAEVATWPLFGLFARLQRCVFLDRTRRSATAEVNALVARRLGEGDAILLFADGTTGDGNRLLPFRSSILEAARAALAESPLGKIALRPLSIVYERRHGLPITRRERPGIAWYGDMELAPHLGEFVRGGPLDAVVVWGEPIPFDAASDRKHLARHAEEAVRAGIRRAARPAAPVHRAANALITTDPLQAEPGPAAS